MSKGIYVGKLSDIPIYETTRVETPITYENANIDQIFAATTGAGITTSDESGYGIKFISSNYSTATETYTVLVDLTNVKIYWTDAAGTAGTTSNTNLYINGAAVTVSHQATKKLVWSGSLSAGDTIKIQVYTSIFSKNKIFYILADDPTIVEETQTIVGYEQKEVARKVPMLYGSIDNVARKIVKGYIGARAPIYETTTVETAIPFEYANVDKIFSHVSTSGDEDIIPWEYDNGIKFAFDPEYAVNRDVSDTYTVLLNLSNIKMYWTNGDDTSGDLLYINDEEITLPTGDSRTLVWSGSLSANDTITMGTYHENVEDISSILEIEADDPVTTKEVQIITGYEDKVTARLFYDSPSFSYTGDYTMSDIEINGTSHRLYTLISSGTLKCNSNAAQYWICGGGAGGTTSLYTSSKRFGGVGGSGGYVASGDIGVGEWVVTIGAGGAGGAGRYGASVPSAGGAGGASSIVQGDTSHTANGGKYTGGGTGGGAGAYTNKSGAAAYADATNGAGVSTIPFDLTALEAHAAGGGGGACHGATNFNVAGNGGTNGGNGGAATKGTTALGGTGGVKGGGSGGNPNSPISGDATFYGSGGGGGYAESLNYSYSGGAGYQGVVYILI